MYKFGPLLLLKGGVAISDLWCVTAKDMLLEYVSKMELPYR